MPKLLLSLILLFSSYVYAEDFNEAIGGSLTYHIFDPNGVDTQFSNKVDSTGMLIRNPLVGFRQVHIEGIDYTSLTYFTGANSIAEPILGVAWSTGIVIDDLRIGFVAGTYLQNNSLYLDKGLVPIMIVPYDGIAPVPVLGMEIIEKKNISKDSYLFFNGLITPILLNATVGIGWRI